jgi:hypothetical protein
MGDGTGLEVTEVSLDELPVFLTVEEAAAVLRIGPTSAYVLCHRWRGTDGEAGLPRLQVGRQLRGKFPVRRWCA